MQNIGIGCNEPICMPDDLALLAKQLRYKICAIESVVDALENSTVSLTDFITCGGTGISMPTTLTESGIYCLSNSLDGVIEISANDIVLDLNGFRVSQGITISPGYNSITIRNGFIENTTGGSGILVQLGSAYIDIRNVCITNAATAIFCSGIDTAYISNCMVSDCLGGVTILNCSNVIIEDTVAENIQQKGFALDSSSTCCVRDCKAISIGENNALDNTDLFNGIIGFDALGGYGNIFERCIANGTQGVAVVKFNSIVAGFRLGDTNGIQEQCTKIIDCEAANTITSASGDTIAYGIFLEATLNSDLTLTAFPPVPSLSTQVHDVDWHPQGNIIAVATSDAGLRIYALQIQNKTLTQIASESFGTVEVNTVRWNQGGTLLAIGFSDGTFGVYSFCFMTNTLTLVARQTIANSTIDSIDWSSDGRYLALFNSGTSADTQKDVLVYAYDSINMSLTFIDSINLFTSGSSPLVDTPYIKWHPTNQYIAAANRAVDPALKIIKFQNNTLTTAQNISGEGAKYQVE